MQEIREPLFEERGIRLWIKRDDLIHPDISGNKWRKLKYNLEQAQRQQKQHLLTFGGAFSNHIRAVAAAAALMGFSSTGIIRGDEARALNANLDFAQRQGMQLVFWDRQRYREKDTPAYTELLKQEFPDSYLIPEGGSNSLALPGVAELFDEIEIPFDWMCCACGTGGTLAGLVSKLRGRAQLIGFPALKGGGFLEKEILDLLGERENAGYFSLETDFHFGGYAKKKPELLAFIRGFQERHCIPLDYVYTGKMMYGVYDKIEQEDFPSGSRIVVLHSGGVANAPVEE